MLIYNIYFDQLDLQKLLNGVSIPDEFRWTRTTNRRSSLRYFNYLFLVFDSIQYAFHS